MNLLDLKDFNIFRKCNKEKQVQTIKHRKAQFKKLSNFLSFEETSAGH